MFLNSLRLPISVVLFVSVALSPTQVLAQASPQVRVTVDDTLVNFRGTGPKQVDGRVLVPLRGIFEQLGAVVGWDASSQTIIADKNETEVKLTIGNPSALVNNRSVTLDVPAELNNGTTLVPLRFVSEALGASVAWNAATQTVSIRSTPPLGSASPKPPIARPRSVTSVSPPLRRSALISSFIRTGPATLGRGQQVTFTLQGAPHSQARMQIPGVTSELRLKEVSPGLYQTVWAVPVASIQVQDVLPVAQLQSDGGVQTSQASESLTIDTEPPTIDSLTPEPDSLVGVPNPWLSASLDDGSGSGVDPASIRMSVDRDDVSGSVQWNDGFVAVQPNHFLSPGQHRVTLTARDFAGNQARRTWTFVVAIPRYTMGFQCPRAEELRPGNTVQFRLQAAPHAKVSFVLGLGLTNVPGREVSAGVYVGSYRVRQGDRFAVAFSARVQQLAGKQYVCYGARLNRANLEAPVAPRLNPPKLVGNQCRVTGQGPRNSAVELRLTYRAAEFGPRGGESTLTRVVARTDAAGRFSSTFAVHGILGVKNPQFSVHAVVAGGRRSPDSHVPVG